MSERSEEELALVDTAKRVMPAGGFGNSREDIIISEGKAGRVWDESGKEYIDYLIGSGPMLVGHAHPDVVAAVNEQITRGTTFFVNNRHGILLAEEIVNAVACAKQVRFTSTGTEADAYAMRLVRAYRNRDTILKFEGGFHGMSDTGLMSLAPKKEVNFPQATHDSAGIPRSVDGDVLVAPYNDIDAVASLIREHGDSLAGVIIEPMQRIINPQAGFLEDLRELTEKHGIPLIFDEVVTGFRLAYGGAQEYYGVVPDVCTLGKAIGGGFGLAAVTGHEEIMAHFDVERVGSERFLLQMGTLSGNPIAATAGLATLKVLREPGTYERLRATGEKLMNGLRDRLAEHGFEATITGAPCMFDAIFTSGEINNYRDTTRGDVKLMRRFNKLLLERGILKSPSKYYVSLAHDERDISETFDAWSDALGVMAAER